MEELERYPEKRELNKRFCLDKDYDFEKRHVRREDSLVAIVREIDSIKDLIQELRIDISNLREELKGNGISSSGSSAFTEISVNHEWVQLWEGGPKFATCNIGANQPWEYGNYYTWGGTHAQSKRKYKDDHWDGDKTLPSSRDIATISWGKEWRIPTEEEFETLLEECGEGEWVEDYMGSGINGRLFRGDGMFAEQELFFPASGYCDHSSFYNLGSDGYYWSSVPYEDNVAWYLSFYNDDVDIYNDKRLSGLSVRAVLNE